MKGLGLTFATCALLFAPRPSLAQAPAAKACSGAEYRQFDFWLGDWEVTDAQGQLAGHNHVERLFGDCVVHENWTAAGGSQGQSFNIYDARTGHWHQTWVDSFGQLLLLDGGLDGKRMVLRGTKPGRDGGEVLHEISWTPEEDGSVTQHWRASRDGGKTWRDIFLGTYRRK